MALLSGFLQKQRFQVVASRLKGDVLDLGCNEAAIIKLLTPNQSYVGVDRSPAMIKWLQQNYRQYEFYQRDFDREALALDDKQFDTILMVAIMEHLKHPHQLIRQAAQYIKPNGVLLITTPTPLGDRIHRVGARLGLFSSTAVEEHETIFTSRTLTPLLIEGDFQVSSYRKFLWGGNQLFVCHLL